MVLRAAALAALCALFVPVSPASALRASRESAGAAAPLGGGALAAVGVDSAAINLWPGLPPNETKGAYGPEVRQDDEGDHCGPSRDLPCYTYYNVSSPTLVPYLAKAGTGTGAAVVVAPGGGYSVLSYNKEGEDVAAYYQSIGVSAFLLKYRVPARPDMEGLPHWWAGLQDAQRAISLVREGVKDGKWSINASMVGFTGFSAGGHLTGHVSTAAERAYAKVDAADEQSHLPNFALFIYPWMLLPNNAAAEWGQPYALADEFANSVTADHPVSFFAHNEDDGVAPCENTIVYHQKLKSVGAAMSTLFVANEGGHGFGLCQELTGNEEICQWWGLAKKWLQDHGLTVASS